MELHKDKHRGRMPCSDGSRDRSEVSMRQRMPRTIATLRSCKWPGWILPQSLQTEHGLVILWLWTSSFQNSGSINFPIFRHPVCANFLHSNRNSTSNFVPTSLYNSMGGKHRMKTYPNRQMVKRWFLGCNGRIYVKIFNSSMRFQELSLYRVSWIMWNSLTTLTDVK